MSNTRESTRRQTGVGGQEQEIGEPESSGRLSVLVDLDFDETIDIPPDGHDFRPDRSTPQGRFWQDGVELTLRIPVEHPRAQELFNRGTDESGMDPLHVRYTYSQDGSSRTLEIPYQSTRGSGWSGLVRPGDPGWHNGFVEQEGWFFGIFLPAGVPRLVEFGKPV